MKASTLGVAAVLFACVPMACGPNAKKDDENKLAGVWEVVDERDNKGSTVEFTSDGKLKIFEIYKGEKDVIDGTYTVEGDTLNIVLIHVRDGKKEVKGPCKITNLSDNELITEDEKGRVDHFKRVH